MPTDDCFGLDDYQRILLASSETKSPAGPSRTGDLKGITAAWPFPLQHSHLLTKREDFDSDISTAPEEDAGSGNEGEDEWQVGLLVLT
jgi:hypothetical protein